MATAEPPVSISDAERRWLSGGIVSGVRGDGRSAADVRPIGVSTGVLPASSGSAEARMAGAHAMVGVKVELEPPLPSFPDRGTVAVTVQISPCAGPQWYGRAGEERAAEVAAAISSALGGVSGGGIVSSSSSGGNNESENNNNNSSTLASFPPAIDLCSLCVAKGAAAWHLRIHCLLLSVDGTSATLTAASAAVAAALADVRIPATTVIGGGGGGGGGESDDGGEGDDVDEEEAAPPEVEVEDDLSKATALDASLVPVFSTIALASSSCSSSSSSSSSSSNCASASASASDVFVPIVSPLCSSVVGLAADPDSAEEAASRASVSAAFDASGLLRASFVSFGGGRGDGGGGAGYESSTSSDGGGGMSPAQLSAALALARSVGARLAREVAGVAKESIAATA